MWHTKCSSYLSHSLCAICLCLALFIWDCTCIRVCVCVSVCVNFDRHDVDNILAHVWRCYCCCFFLLSVILATEGAAFSICHQHDYYSCCSFIFFFYFCIRICGHLVDILLARLLWAKTARKKQSTHTRTEFLAVWEKSFSFLPQHLCFYSFAVRWRFKFSPAC